MLTRPNSLDIKNIVYQQVIDKEEINEAFKMAEEDLARERAGSPRFEYNDPTRTPIGTPAMRTPRQSLESSGPSTSGTTTTRTTRRTPATTPAAPKTSQRSTRGSTPVVYPDSAYGGIINGHQYYGRYEARLGETKIHPAAQDGNCFFQ